MSNCSPSCETPPSAEQEPTLATMPVVGSSASNNTSHSWENGSGLGEPSNLCVISSIVSNTSSSALAPSNNPSSTSRMSSAISEDAINSTDFLHSGIIQDVGSTSTSLNICEDMLVDEPLQSASSVSAIVSHESMCVSHEDSDASNDHLNVMDNITAQNFLQEPDLLNAATSVLHREKSSPGGEDDIISKSDISHNLMSSLEHDGTQEPEPMEMQNLLHDHSDLDGSVPSIAGYRLDHSQASNLSVGSSSQLDIEVNSATDLPSEDLCFSPSSVSNASDLNLCSSISTNMGLPPVSTIIRSSSAKGRFDSFCRQSNINMIMNMPPFLNSSTASYDAMSSMGAIQRITADHCDVLTAVSLTSPLDVPSSRPIVCTDMAMDNVDVPLSSSLVCSTASNDLHSSSIGSRCIRTTSSVMSSLGPPDLADKNSPLSEMSESQIQSSNNLGLSLRASDCQNFPGVIPIRDMNYLDNSSTQVSLLSAMRLEDIQKVAAISEHLRSQTAIDGALCSTDEEALAQSIMNSPHFSSRNNLNSSENFRNSISHSSQSLPILSVSAIETNVIMSTSNIDSTAKLTNSNLIKDMESSHQIKEHQRQNLGSMDNQLENSAIQSHILNKSIEAPRSSSIIFGKQISNNVLSRIPSQCGLVSRSSIIERNVHHTIKMDSSGAGSVEINLSPSNGSVSGSPQVKLEGMESLEMSPKLEERTPSEENSSQSLSSISPSAVTASVIQQLLKAQASQSEIKSSGQRIPCGVITSVTSAKSEMSSAPRQSNPLLPPIDRTEEGDQKGEMGEGSPVAPPENTQRTLFVNVGGGRKLSICMSDESLDAVRDKSAELAFTVDSNKGTTTTTSSTLSSLTSVPLPSLFTSLSASTLASLKSSLSTPMQGGTLSGTSPSVSLLSSLQSGFISPSISGVPSILLPNILSSTLRSASSSGIKTSEAACLSVNNPSGIYSGLLKSVGLSTVVKQEPNEERGSGPLPPFTVVSGFPSLVKRELSVDLASMYLNANNAHIPTVVASKQETTSKQQSLSSVTSASEFSGSSILSAATHSSLTPEATSVQPQMPPVVTPIELSVVVASSTTEATILPTIPSPVPSQTSTIAFASTTTTPPPVRIKEEPGTTKKNNWNCSMCKNGSPCGLHPTQSSQGGGSSSSGPTGPLSASVVAPPPILSGDPAKPFQCSLCGKHLASKNVYQLHLRSHSGEKPFTCNLCGHHFSQKTSLTRHMRSHTGERPFPCEACGKRFADKERIKIHMRTHTGEKPFACEICGKRFSQKSTVKRHMSVHTGEKPFKCLTCGKGFANRGNLNAHSKTHAGS